MQLIIFFSKFNQKHLDNLVKKLVSQFTLQSDYFTRKNYFTERKRALHYIYPLTLYVEFTVRVGARIR